jgi:hypothetical protein
MSVRNPPGRGDDIARSFEFFRRSTNPNNTKRKKKPPNRLNRDTQNWRAAMINYEKSEPANR